MKLYHLTSLYHLPAVLSAGYLKTVESNISLVPWEEHKGPDVVWLTTSQRRGQGWSEMRLDSQRFVDKCRIRIEVAVDDDQGVQPWYDWARAHGSDEHTMIALAASGDENHGLVRVGIDPALDQASLERARAEWYVVERTVPWIEWVSVTDQLAGTCIWRNSLEQQKSGQMVLSKLWTSNRMRGGDATLMLNSGKGWRPTTILSEENPGAVVQIGGGPPDVVLDARQPTAEEVEQMTPAERRAFFNGVAPSVNVMRDLLGMDE